MVTYSDLRINSIQAVMYTPNLDQFQPPQLLADILGKHAGQYNGNLEVQQFPPEVPIEIPRIVMQSKDGEFKIQAGPSRIDSFWHDISPKNHGSADFGGCTNVLCEYLEANKELCVGRLALVISRISDKIENPAQALVDRFCNESSKQQPFNNSRHFEIHNHKRYKPSGYDQDINSWVRCRALTVSEQETGKQILHISQDLNTLAESIKQNQFDAESARKFYEIAAEEAQSILEIYFP